MKLLLWKCLRKRIIHKLKPKNYRGSAMRLHPQWTQQISTILITGEIKYLIKPLSSRLNEKLERIRTRKQEKTLNFFSSTHSSIQYSLTLIPWVVFNCFALCSLSLWNGIRLIFGVEFWMVFSLACDPNSCQKLSLYIHERGLYQLGSNWELITKTYSFFNWESKSNWE